MAQESSKEFRSAFGSFSNSDGQVTIPISAISGNVGGGKNSMKFKGQAQRVKTETFQKDIQG
jgi:hypothetical protein